jgi:hypothetical protein
VDPTTAFLLLIFGIIALASARSLLDYFVEPTGRARLLLNALTGTLCVILLGLLVVLAIALKQDPQACPWNGCS